MRDILLRIGALIMRLLKCVGMGQQERHRAVRRSERMDHQNEAAVVRREPRKRGRECNRYISRPSASFLRCRRCAIPCPVDAHRRQAHHRTRMGFHIATLEQNTYRRHSLVRGGVSMCWPFFTYQYRPLTSRVTNNLPNIKLPSTYNRILSFK